MLPQCDPSHRINLLCMLYWKRINLEAPPFVWSPTIYIRYLIWGCLIAGGSLYYLGHWGRNNLDVVTVGVL